MENLKYSALSNIVNKFAGKKIMVIGDLMLDQFIWGGVSRISPEAPVPVVKVENEDYMPGGACNVANNLAKLGAKVYLVGVIGNDSRAGILKNLLIEREVNIDGVIVDESRPTIQKTRIIAKHRHQHVVRIDWEDGNKLDRNILNKIVDYVRENVKNVDGIIIEDYGKGLISPSLIKEAVSSAKKYNKTVSVDPKEEHFSYYKGVSAITPNHNEAEKGAGFKIKDDEDLLKAGNKMLAKLKAEVVLITLGERGMMVFEEKKKPCHIPTVAQEVFDVSGAGDTVIAVYTLAVVSGASATRAAYIANCAAGIVVGKIGTASADRKEILDGLRKLNGKVGI